MSIKLEEVVIPELSEQRRSLLQGAGSLIHRLWTATPLSDRESARASFTTGVSRETLQEICAPVIVKDDRIKLAEIANLCTEQEFTGAKLNEFLGRSILYLGDDVFRSSSNKIEKFLLQSHIHTIGDLVSHTSETLEKTFSQHSLRQLLEAIKSEILKIKQSDHIQTPQERIADIAERLKIQPSEQSFSDGILRVNINSLFRDIIKMNRTVPLPDRDRIIEKLNGLTLDSLKNFLGILLRVLKRQNARQVIELHYGLIGEGKCFSQAAIAQQLDRSASVVGQIKRLAILTLGKELEDALPLLSS